MNKAQRHEEPGSLRNSRHGFVGLGGIFPAGQIHDPTLGEREAKW